MKRRKQFFTVGAVLTAVLTVILYLLLSPADRKEEEYGAAHAYRRIVSMAPNITETVFALGLGDRLVGVTDYCTYPPEAETINKVGGYLNPNYEALLALKPDLVILLPEQANIKRYVQELNIAVLEVNNKTVEDILQSILTIGSFCNVKPRADSIVYNIRQRIDVVKNRVKDLPVYRILISIGRSVGSGNLGEVYAAGKNTYYDELITYAGGINVVTKSMVEYPVLSAEGIIRLNPDIIIDFVRQDNRTTLSDKEIKKDWTAVKTVNALKNSRYYIFGQRYAVIPGPRFINLLEDLSTMIHPR